MPQLYTRTFTVLDWKMLIVALDVLLDVALKIKDQVKDLEPSGTEAASRVLLDHGPRHFLFLVQES